MPVPKKRQIQINIQAALLTVALGLLGLAFSMFPVITIGFWTAAGLTALKLSLRLWQR